MSRPVCHVCGSSGAVYYRGLRDELYEVAGEWNFRRCSNQECGLMWLDPMPAEADLGKLYRNYHTHEFIEASTAALPVRLMERFRSAYCAAQYGSPDQRRWSGRVLRHLSWLLPGVRAQWDFSAFHLPARQHGRLLDVGCGSGKMMRRMAKLGWHVQGIDFDPNAVKAARDQGLDVRLGTVEEQDFEDGAFDAVVMSHVIEHVPDPRTLLQGCKRILKPGGQLVSITPNASSWGHRRYGACWRGLEPPRHLHIFTAEAMKKLGEELAFSNSQVSSIVANSHAILWSSREMDRTGKAMPFVFSLRNEAQGRLMQFAEWVLVCFSRGAGEELLFQATK